MKLQVAIVAFSTSFCREYQETDALPANVFTAIMGTTNDTLTTSSPPLSALNSSNVSVCRHSVVLCVVGHSAMRAANMLTLVTNFLGY